jgi:peptide/nickel transport system substrate-binding protein
VGPGLLLATLLAAAGGAAAGVDTLVVGTLADPASLETHQATDVVAAEIVANVCDTLVRVRPGTQRPEGILATTWATRDHRVWTFTLREGVLFQDGARLDADAVVSNFEHLRSERAFPGRAVRVGPLVVQIVLDRPNVALLSTLSQPFFSIQSPGHLTGPGSRVPVGSGPFRLVSRAPGLVVLGAYHGHWGGAPRLRRILVRRFPDEEALIRAIRSGAVDVTSAVGPTRAAELRGDPEITLDSTTGLNLVYLALNNERPPFDQVRVREAISRAIDRAALVRDATGGHGETADTPLPPSLVGHDVRTRELVLDRDASRRLLARAGFPDGLDAELTVSSVPRPYLLEPLRVAARLRDDLSRVGLRVSVREVPTWTEQVDLTSHGDFAMALLGWQADTLDPNDFLTALLDSGSIGTTNRSRYRSLAMDSLLKRARMDDARRARMGLYRQAQELFPRDMPFVPLYHAPVLTVHRRHVNGLVIGPTGIPRYEKTWKQP